MNHGIGNHSKALAVGLALGLGSMAGGHAQDVPYFGIRVIDEASGRGVPLVELETVHHLRFVTDSAGWVALNEPELMDQPVFFLVKSHGYEFPKDGFGYAGKVLTPAAGATATLRVKRVNLAERLYRLTGAGIYRDSVLLGQPVPLAHPLGTAQVVGQDSVFGLPFEGRLFWFWGDTSRMKYPLGHFWMAGAVSDLPAVGGLDPAAGVNLRYFVDAEGFSRPLCRLGVKTGLIWADGFTVLPDEDGRDRLVCHYAHMESLYKTLGHGLAIYDETQEAFEALSELDLESRWRWPAQAHPFRHRHLGVEYLYAGEVFPTARVPARLADYTRLESYEAWTCLAPDSPEGESRLLRHPDGRLRYEWRKHAVPVDSAREMKWLQAGAIKAEEANALPVDVDSGEPVRMHRGSVHWNAWRQRWIMIAAQLNGTSNLGEIWYAEAPAPTGPWRRAKKIVTHDRYDFYNPVHHPFFDQEGGRFIYFEGTYVNTFSGNPVATPRYDYNQIMYRLDLGDPRLEPARELP